MRLSLYEFANGVEPMPGNRIVYDPGRGEAWCGESGAEGRALMWEPAEYPGDEALLTAQVDLDRSRDWLMRCDRVDFPRGGVAYRHTHPGPGIRYLLLGSIRIESGGETNEYGPSQAWFESGPEPVFAAASETEDTAFVRVMVLPREWEGRRTIRYVDPADDEQPKLQRATIFLEHPIAL